MKLHDPQHDDAPVTSTPVGTRRRLFALSCQACIEAEGRKERI